MIALAMGVIVGIPVAFILGKLLGKASEALIAITGVPLITYALALQELGPFAGPNVSIEGSPEFTAGTETFLGLIIALTYVELRTRKGLRIDDFIQISFISLPYISLGVALASQFWRGFLAVGIALIGIVVALSMKNPLRGLNVKPCPQEIGDCLTDEDSLMGAVIGGAVIVGGRTLREFPRARELVECMKRAGKPSSLRKATGLLVSLLPLLAVLLPPGDITVIAGLATAYISTLIGAALVTKGQPAPCPGVAREYREFLRKRKRKIDVAV
ncbi:hypothetical protein CL1_1745 [Thermococcus cleftensis]|uniref:Uncharacterized protein n=1 Tax=Thermococcus cleftensis (strain DSM 27260 / KACC 17922 / CL1) TaxID=163003 RepID=I3ZW57_THECF|nr:hypothetical protein [Thermococcus cleftensis]AFL95941.1 hypothetical protein CL1_1745 [Thermococcus cleftensis]